MIRSYPVSVAKRVLTHWFDTPDRLQLISHSGNSVYRVFYRGVPKILRITDPTYRSREACEGEIEFIEHLHRSGVNVSVAIPSLHGNCIEMFQKETCIASMFHFAPGKTLRPDLPGWNREFLYRWGQVLGKIHQASQTFLPVTNKRWSWEQEIFFQKASLLLPKEDRMVSDALKTVFSYFTSYPKHAKNFGMIHADFGPQNFHYDSKVGITCFDFGNCCLHWFLADVAISLSLFLNFSEKNRVFATNSLLAGYQDIIDLQKEEIETIPWLILLRLVYVYLARRFAFGKNPTREQKKLLRERRARIASAF